MYVNTYTYTHMYIWIYFHLVLVNNHHKINISYIFPFWHTPWQSKKLLAFFCVIMALTKYLYYIKECPEGRANQASKKPSGCTGCQESRAFLLQSDITPGVWDIALRLCLVSLIFNWCEACCRVSTLLILSWNKLHAFSVFKTNGNGFFACISCISGFTVYLETSWREYVCICVCVYFEQRCSNDVLTRKFSFDLNLVLECSVIFICVSYPIIYPSFLFQCVVGEQHSCSIYIQSIYVNTGVIFYLSALCGRQSSFI